MHTIKIDIHDSFNKMLQESKNENYNNTILPILQSIKKNSVLHYNLEKSNERQIYFFEYLNKINALILAFNSYLLQEYWEMNSSGNKIDEKNDYLDLLKEGNKINKISYLLFYYLQNNKNCNLYINKFYIWENIFRHQICHGWLDFFIILYKLQNNTIISFHDREEVRKKIRTIEIELKSKGIRINWLINQCCEAQI